MGLGDDDRWRSLLIDVLTTLAADAAEQLAWLGDDGVLTNDIVDDFELAMRLAQQLAAEGSVDRKVLPELQAIDLVLESMNGRGHAHWWSDALVADEGWDKVRTLARQTLIVLVGDWRLPVSAVRRSR
ncbi:hypothetical protein WEI85_35815 [Actinomycetes bacterium KLBMP 9797]